MTLSEFSTNSCSLLLSLQIVIVEKYIHAFINVVKSKRFYHPHAVDAEMRYQGQYFLFLFLLLSLF